MLVLNIGLETVHGGKLDHRAAFAAIAGKTAGAVYCGVITLEGREPTLVVVASSLNPLAINRLAQHFAQDCIAVWDTVHKSGALIGPNAAAWGAFDPALFVMPDAVTLA